MSPQATIILAMIVVGIIGVVAILVAVSIQ
jgi:hypothetical protein